MIIIKIKIFYPIYLFSLFLMIICLSGFSVMMCMGGYEDLDKITLFIVIMFLVVFPIALFIWSLFTMANTIKIDENGVARYRFGKIVKMFRWNEINTFDYTSNSQVTGWCYISNKKKKYGYNNVTKMRLDKEVIYFHLSKKALTILKIYAKNIDSI